MTTTAVAPLAITVEGHVATLTLNRPETLNAFDEEMHTAFDRAVDELHQLDGVRAAVLASTGKVFSAGGDFDVFTRCHADPIAAQRIADEGQHLLTQLIALPYPIISAVQGAAIGLGATVSLACDMIVAARSAKFGDPHVLVGLVAGDGGCLVWPQSVGMARAKRFLLTGDTLSAEDAYQFGLVTDLVDTPDEALPAAQALARKVAALPPVAVQGTKRALATVMAQRAAEVVSLGFSYETRTFATEDILEAVAAAKERRPGVYQGR